MTRATRYMLNWNVVAAKARNSLSRAPHRHSFPEAQLAEAVGSPRKNLGKFHGRYGGVVFEALHLCNSHPQIVS